MPHSQLGQSTESVPAESPSGVRRPRPALGGLRSDPVWWRKYELFCQGALADPYPIYLRLRCDEPVHWSDGFNGWLLTRYGDVQSALKDPRLPSGRRLDSYMNQLPGDEWARSQPLRSHYSTWLVNLDPPDHTRLRTLVSKAFTPRMVEQLRPFIASMANELIDAHLSQGQMEFISEFARPLPARVISRLLGIRTEESAQFEHWSENISAFTGSGRPKIARARAAHQAVDAMSAFVRGLVARRRARPCDDLLSALVSIEEQGDRLCDQELIGMTVFLLVAGHETTMSLLANGLLALVKHPDQLVRLQADRSLMSWAVEEFLRYESPLQHQVRTAGEDLEIGGVSIKRGQRVVLLLGAANRDPHQFTDPDQLDLSRNPNHHLAFGLGIHYCLGASLARLEAHIVFHTLLDRFASIRLVEPQIRWRRHTSMRNPDRLSVEFC